MCPRDISRFLRSRVKISKWGKMTRISEKEFFPRNYLHNGIGASKPWNDTWNANWWGEFSAESNWRSGTGIIAFMQGLRRIRMFELRKRGPYVPSSIGGLVFMNEIHYACIKWRDLCTISPTTSHWQWNEKSTSSSTYVVKVAVKKNDKITFLSRILFSTCFISWNHMIVA